MIDSTQTVHRHFLAQDERPAPVREVEIERLDPFLRGLLFTDGTVTRALEVQALAPVSVERVGQREVPLPPEAAEQLEIDAGEDSIRRRVRIGVGSASPLIWAESYLLPERLPPGFMSLLEGAPDGIGQSVQRVALESCRELLWFGLDAPPEWAAVAETERGTALRRLYRIVNDRHASILISESFAVRERSGLLHLAGLGAGAAAEQAPLEGLR